MKKAIVLAVMVMFSAFAVAPVFASSHMTPDGKLTMDKPVDKWPAAKMKDGKKAKGPVTFNHTKHAADLGCVECHHSDKDLKAGGKPAKLCFDCHTGVKQGEKQSDTYEMIHKGASSCLGCHKDNEKAKAAKAPTSCKACHGGTD